MMVHATNERPDATRNICALAKYCAYLNQHGDIRSCTKATEPIAAAPARLECGANGAMINSILAQTPFIAKPPADAQPRSAAAYCARPPLPLLYTRTEGWRAPHVRPLQHGTSLSTGLHPVIAQC